MMNHPQSINRRTAMWQVGTVAACAAVSSHFSYAAESVPRTGMGLVIYNCNLRRKCMAKQNPDVDLFQPLTFLKHCYALGAGGMQANLGVMNSREIEQLLSFAEKHELFVDAIISPPTNDGDVARFDAEIRTARDVGVQAVRTTIIPGRRYERFKSLEDFREFEARGRKMLELAAPVVEKHRVPFAVENHKDQRLDERIALFKHLDSEYIGACLDTGNSFALLDGAYEPVEALAPYAFTVHLKDQSLRQYKDGFLLGDIPLGQGSFDLRRMLTIIRNARPDVKFSLELITRDALEVPCLTEEYYATMPEARASDLARTMKFVSEHSTTELQQVSALPLEKQVELEDANVAASIQFAREELKL